MRKYYQYLGLAFIMAFSFYYTEKIALIVLNKNPLMQVILEEKENYEVGYVNAVILGDYIIPGIKGLEVNTRDSFYEMQEEKVFNEAYLVYEEVDPEVSIKDHKDKIIKKGNRSLNKVSFILKEEGIISNYLRAKEYQADLLVNLDTYQEGSYFEVINHETEGYASLENTLNLNKENHHICVLNGNNYELCLDNDKYLVEPTLSLTGSNYLEVKENLDRGSIILIDHTAQLKDVKLLLKEIQFRNYKLVWLSELVSEDCLQS